MFVDDLELLYLVYKTSAKYDESRAYICLLMIWVGIVHEHCCRWISSLLNICDISNLQNIKFELSGLLKTSSGLL